MNSHQSRKRLLITTASLVVVGACLTTSVNAQFGEAAGIAEAMQPDYYSRDLVIFDEGLNLDESQKVIVEAMFHDYEEEFDRGMDRMRDRYDELRPHMESDDEQRILRLVFTPIEEWATEKTVLADQFLENVKVVLTEQQLETWPAFERRLFREKNLPGGRLSGESLNLFHVIRDLHLNTQTMAMIESVLESYDLALDQALRTRKQVMTKSQKDMFRSLADQDSNLGLSVQVRQIEQQIAVRSVNDYYIDEIATALPEENREAFRQAALERGYPRIYRLTPVQRMFETARELDGLTSETYQSVLELEYGYLSELVPINESLLTAVKEYEPKESRLRAEMFAKRMGGTADDTSIEDPTRAQFLKRDELSRRYAVLLQSILTAEQFALIPGGHRWARQSTTESVTDAAGTERISNSRKRGRVRSAVRTTDEPESAPDE